MVLFIILTVLYFIPSIIAFNNKKMNRVAVLMLNLFLGWTFIGWVVALVWALTRDTHVVNGQTVVVEPPKATSIEFKKFMKWTGIIFGTLLVVGLMMTFFNRP